MMNSAISLFAAAVGMDFGVDKAGFKTGQRLKMTEPAGTFHVPDFSTMPDSARLNFIRKRRTNCLFRMSYVESTCHFTGNSLVEIDSQQSECLGLQGRRLGEQRKLVLLVLA